jgi:hypothetical protein
VEFLFIHRMKNTNRSKSESPKQSKKAASNCLPWWNYAEDEKSVAIINDSMAPRAPKHSIITYLPGTKARFGNMVVAKLKGQTSTFIGVLDIRDDMFSINPANPEFKPLLAPESAFESVWPVAGWSTLLTEEGQRAMAERVKQMEAKLRKVKGGAKS